ncbi:MAG: DUF948 domain-containing protein [Alphaproteobacteria bacterium]|uniref:DUF948 domain-containing protein n=1 Tax=Candidatus Nitrobium versatile TaxID=2884831 RepID=A0A953JCZ4_9BACT|nr:DUF948 domain-containing protein [Candidatus Nitrobium versatile]
MSDSLLIFLSFGFFILVLGILVAVGFLVYALLEMRRVAAALEEFIKRTESSLIPVLLETEQTLRSMRKVSDDVGIVTENVRDISGAAQDIVVNLRMLSGLLNAAEEGVNSRVSGMKAGLRTAFGVLLQQIRERR